MYNITIMRERLNSPDDPILYHPAGIDFPKRCSGCPYITEALEKLSSLKLLANKLAERALNGTDDERAAAIATLDALGEATEEGQLLVDKLTSGCAGRVDIEGSNGMIRVTGSVCGSMELSGGYNIEPAEVQRELK